MLRQGEKAPEFTLNDKDGKLVSLSDFKGKRVVVYFYPKDNTSGCTKEAVSFRDNYPAIVEKNAVVIGISPDSEKSHRSFGEKHQLPFILLSDPDKAVAQAFGAWGEKKNYGKTYMGIIRSTFVINEEGIIEKVFAKVNTSIHGEEVLHSM